MTTESVNTSGHLRATKEQIKSFFERAEKTLRKHKQQSRMAVEQLRMYYDREWEYCDVCFESYFCSNDYMMKCQVCDLMVHQSCYGTRWHSEDDHFICFRCAYLLNENKTHDQIRCCFCPELKGSIRPLFRDYSREWSHISCLNYKVDCWWDNESLGFVAFSNQTTEPFQIKRNLPCNICGSKYGWVIDCDHQGCSFKAHVTCCAKVGVIRGGDDMSYVSELMGYENHTFVIVVYCLTHLRKHVQKDQMAKVMDFIQKMTLGQTSLFDDPDSPEISKYMNQKEYVHKVMKQFKDVPSKKSTQMQWDEEQQFQQREQDQKNTKAKKSSKRSNSPTIDTSQKPLKSDYIPKRVQRVQRTNDHNLQDYAVIKAYRTPEKSGIILRSSQERLTKQTILSPIPEQLEKSASTQKDVTPSRQLNQAPLIIFKQLEKFKSSQSKFLQQNQGCQDQYQFDLMRYFIEMDTKIDNLDELNKYLELTTTSPNQAKKIIYYGLNVPQSAIVGNINSLLSIEGDQRTHQPMDLKLLSFNQEEQGDSQRSTPPKVATAPIVSNTPMQANNPINSTDLNAHNITDTIAASPQTIPQGPPSTNVTANDNTNIQPQPLSEMNTQQVLVVGQVEKPLKDYKETKKIQKKQKQTIDDQHEFKEPQIRKKIKAPEQSYHQNQQDPNVAFLHQKLKQIIGFHKFKQAFSLLEDDTENENLQRDSDSEIDTTLITELGQKQSLWSLRRSEQYYKQLDNNIQK